MNQTSLFDHYSAYKYNNQSLFSDHYLNEILRRETVWQEAQAETAVLLDQLRQLYQSQREQLPLYNESQLEDNWFRPVLTLLGHTMEGQPTIPGLGGGIKKPDYVFFPDEAARLTAVSTQNSADYAQNALAVGEVKAWEVNLSRKTGKSPTFADNNPMYQIDTYLRATGLEWGILSNGRFWRLIHKESAYRLDSYFEIDLLAALSAGSDRAATASLNYFLLFFRQAAFLPDARLGKPFLNHALDASRAYARALEADLRDNAYRALEQLIRGFFIASPHQLDPQQPADREKVYRNSLYLLYRFLFLLYGESRGLLPMDNQTYEQNYSLTSITAAINQSRNRIETMPTTGRSYWNRLHELFRLISGVDPQLNAELRVPRYNGGLFLPERHPFLEQHPIGDRYLVQAIDYLAYRRVRENGRFEGYERVDYRTLSERQLGSIYEGLLEYRVSLAETEMVTIRKGGVEQWVPAAERGRATALDRRRPGELYMATDKGERKATGSYYTPDYIVKYIVEQTLGPLIEQIRAEVKAEIDGRSDLNEAQKQAHGSARFVARILALNILDPAMGSGHFLVEATHFLARALATDPFVMVDGEEKFNPKGQREQRDEEKPLASLPSLHLGVENGPGEADLVHWRRRVVEACIYGVDKNEMAVELAKLSLWLVTAAADKPLSFLDHHLRHGDSLVGAWLADLERPPLSSSSQTAAEGQEPLFDESAFTGDAGLAVKGLMTIERLPSEDIEDVYAKERTYREIRQTHLARWRELANLWVSAYFGNTMSREEYRDLALRLQGRSEESMLRESQAQPYLTHPAMGRPDYFHWELEFPEVFFDEYGRSLGKTAGFDAVIGNPPYGTPSTNSNIFLQNLYIQGFADNYVYFIERGVNLAQPRACLSYIIPNTWAQVFSANRFRHFLTTQLTILEIVHLSDPVFTDATVDTEILSIRKSTPTDDTLVTIRIWDKDGETNQFSVPQTEWITPDGDIISVLTQPHIAPIVQKIEQHSVPLNKFSEIKNGVKPFEEGKGNPPQTSQIMAEKPFVSTLQIDDSFVPLLRGSLIDRYTNYWRNDYWISYGPWLAAPRDPAIFFEVDEKIVMRQTGADLIATKIDNSFVARDNLHLILGMSSISLDYLLALLNSKLLGFYYHQLNPETGETFAQVKLAHLERLPIVPISFDSSQKERTAVVQTAQAHYEAGELTAVLAWCESELENGRNDTIHDLLAYLAGQMIALNRAQQERVARFWLDLEGVLADPDTFAKLRHKGKWAQSLHKKVAAARPYVDSDSRSTITLDASLGWNEEAFTGFVRELAGSVRRSSGLVDVYRDHAGEYGRLSHQITTTDHLIDQIVYRLYGLTDDEIAIVEGA
jgi:hypothetical protein